MGNDIWDIGCKDTLGFETKCDLTYITFFWEYHCSLSSSSFIIIVSLCFIIIIINCNTSVLKERSYHD